MIPISVSEISALDGFCDVQQDEELGILVIGLNLHQEGQPSVLSICQKMHQSNAVCIYEFWTFHVIYHWMTEGDILQFYSVAVWAGWACSAQPVEATNLLMKPRMFHLQKSQVWSWWRFWVSECLIAVAVRYIERKVSKTICIKQMKQHKSWNPYCFIVFMIICYIYYLCHVYKF